MWCRQALSLLSQHAAAAVVGSIVCLPSGAWPRGSSCQSAWLHFAAACAGGRRACRHPHRRRTRATGGGSGSPPCPAAAAARRRSALVCGERRAAQWQRQQQRLGGGVGGASADQPGGAAAGSRGRHLARQGGGCCAVLRCAVLCHAVYCAAPRGDVHLPAARRCPMQRLHGAHPAAHGSHSLLPCCPACPPLQVRATGPGGRVLKGDVLAHLEALGTAGAGGATAAAAEQAAQALLAAAAAQGAPVAPAAAAPAAAAAAGAAGAAADLEPVVVPLRGYRKVGLSPCARALHPRPRLAGGPWCVAQRPFLLPSARLQLSPPLLACLQAMVRHMTASAAIPHFHFCDEVEVWLASWTALQRLLKGGLRALFAITCKHSQALAIMLPLMYASMLQRRHGASGCCAALGWPCCATAACG